VKVSVVGATGLVGREVVRVLAEIKFPIRSVTALASFDSAGTEISYGISSRLTVKDIKEHDFSGDKIAFFVAGDGVSHSIAKKVASTGCIVIDNSAYFRMHSDVPLVIPEVNPHQIQNFNKCNIIANPNCSTIQMLLALKPLHDFAKIKKVFISTYQSVSGVGSDAVDELYERTKQKFIFNEQEPRNFPRPIEFNCIPQVGQIEKNGFCDEEKKIIEETKKIMEDDSIQIIPTCVRVPVFACHGQAISVEFEESIKLKEIAEVLEDAKGIIFCDKNYKTQADSAGYNDVFVCRLRQNNSNTISMWTVADNVRKGAALNAVQIAQSLLKAIA
jgi:aspartate-semialdehyde dehydrogenase